MISDPKRKYDGKKHPWQNVHRMDSNPNQRLTDIDLNSSYPSLSQTSWQQEAQHFQACYFDMQQSWINVQ